MRIKSLKAWSVYELLDFDLKFNDSITFLTGINGSGKTTVLNLITSIFLPRWDHLIQQNFERVLVEFTSNKDKFKVEMKLANEKLFVKCDTVNKSKKSFKDEEIPYNDIGEYYS